MDCLDLNLDLGVDKKDNSPATQPKTFKSKARANSIVPHANVQLKRSSEAGLSNGTPAENRRKPTIKPAVFRSSSVAPSSSAIIPDISFAEPSFTGRQRHKAVRRYSPEPNVHHNTTPKKKIYRVKCSDFGNILRSEVRNAEFTEFSIPASWKKKKTSRPPSSASKKEYKDDRSDNEDEDIGGNKPIVRMSDIGAAPFQSTSSSSSSSYRASRSGGETKNGSKRKTASGSFKFNLSALDNTTDTSFSSGSPQLKIEDSIGSIVEEQTAKASMNGNSGNEEIAEKTEAEVNDSSVLKAENSGEIAKVTKKRKPAQKKSKSALATGEVINESATMPTEPMEKSSQENPPEQVVKKKARKKKQVGAVDENIQEKMDVPKLESPTVPPLDIAESDAISVPQKQLKDVRRSGRATIHTEKMKELTDSKVSTPGSAKTINPNSALAIKKRVQKSLPIEKQSEAKQTDGDNTKKKEGKKLENADNNASEIVVGEDLITEQADEKGTPPPEKLDVVDVVPAEEIAQNPVFTALREELQNDIAALESDIATSIKKIVPDENVVKPKKPAVVPPPVQPTRSSGRVHRPSRRFEKEFVTEMPGTSPRLPVPKKKKIVQVNANPSSSSTSTQLDTSMEENLPEKNPPIRLKIRLAPDPKVEKPLDDQVPEKVVPVTKPKKRCEIVRGVLHGYQPSVKPVIEGFRRSDGSWENLGIVVGSVMDRLLAEVCQDGITRHCKIMSNKSRKERIITVAKASYNRRKAEAEAKGVKMDVKHRPIAVKNTEDLVEGRKRRRDAVSRNEDYVYMPLKRERKEDPEYQPMETSSHEDDEYVPEKTSRRDSRVHKKQIEFLSKQFSKDMDDAIKEANIDYESSRRKTPLGSSDELSDYEQKSKSKEKAKKKKNKKEPRQTVPLMNYLTSRGVTKTNDFSVNLLNPNPTSSNDPFYREFLVDTNGKEDYQSDDDSNEGLTVDDVADPIGDVSPSTLHLEAVNVAQKIEALLVRPSSDGGNYSVSDMYRRTSEQPETHRCVFDCALNAITEQYVVECSVTTNVDPVKSDLDLYTKTTYNATQLKNAFTMFDNERQDSVYWVHKFLIESLPSHFLSAYLVLLKYAKSMTCSFIGMITKSTTEDDYPWPDVTSLISTYVSTRPVDPELESINNTIPSQRLSNVVFLLVSPTMSVGDFVHKARYHETLFKWLKQIGSPHSEIIRFKDDEDDYTISLSELGDDLVTHVCDKVREKVQELPEARIVLVGWGFTTYVVHYAVQSVHGVSAIIDFGFPVLSDFGRRGTCDDDILLTYCPSLFIVGADGTRFDAQAMKDLRASMTQTTGLVVLGHANDHLLVSKNVLLGIGVTQKLIYRLVLEQVIDFLQLDDTFKERTQLFPVELNNILAVDSTLRNEKPPPITISGNTTSAAQIGVRRATVGAISTSQDSSPRAQPIKKKKTEMLTMPLPSPLTSNLPLSAPVPMPSPSATNVDIARSHFAKMMMKQVNFPEERRVEKRLQVEKGDLRDRTQPSHSVQPSPVPESKSPAPLDPASISLN